MAEGYIDEKGRIRWSDMSRAFQWFEGPEHEDDESDANAEELHGDGDDEDEQEEED